MFLFDETAPQYSGEVVFTDTDAAYEVVFKSLDSTFRGVDPVIVWFNQLLAFVFLFEIGLDCL